MSNKAVRRVCRAFLVMAVLVASGSLTVGMPPRVDRSYFVYFCDSPHLIDRADSILNVARGHLLEKFGDTLPVKATVYIVDNQSHFDRLVGGRFPEWGAAAALPSRATMVIKSPDHFNINKPLEYLLPHEYVHLVLAHRTAYHHAPRWFEEGAAMMISAEWSWSDNLAMGRAAVFGDFIKLAEIDKVNRFAEGKAHVAYAESYLAVTYFFNEYGAAQVGIFLDSLSRGVAVDQAMRGATGATQSEFQQEFFEHLHKQFNLTSVVTDTMFFWIGLAVVVVIAYILRYNKRRQYYKKWEEEEKYQSTDFDYGDPDRPEQIDDEDEPWRG